MKSVNANGEISSYVPNLKLSVCFSKENVVQLLRLKLGWLNMSTNVLKPFVGDMYELKKIL